MGIKKYFLFDLDGTVADNGEGILKSAQYALDAFGIHGEPEEKLRGRPFMSPSWSFTAFPESRLSLLWRNTGSATG